MGKKLDEAYYKIKAQAEHHMRLAQDREGKYDTGFAQGYYEALIIITEIRNR